MNLFCMPPEGFEGEFAEILAKGPDVRIERIVSSGQASEPGFWYDQSEDEWVLLVSGQAELQFEDGTVALSPGDSLLIPAHTKHRVSITSRTPPCFWLCVFGSFNAGGGLAAHL